MKTNFTSLQDILSYYKAGTYWFLQGDRNLPYICHAGHFLYFGANKLGYNLVMESTIDLQEKKK